MFGKMSLCLLLLCIEMIYTTSAAGPGSCVGRCGEGFIRGQQCTCDFNCLQHNECCQDFQATCTSGQSCKGRCGEMFRRGQLCECDPQCSLYNTCCYDYQQQCAASVSHSQSRALQALRAPASGKRKPKKSKKSSNSESEEWYTGRRPCPQNAGAQCSGASNFLNSPSAGTSGLSQLTQPAAPWQHGVSNSPGGLLPLSIPSFHGGSPDPAGPGSSVPGYGAPSLGSGALVGPSGAGPAGAQVNVHLMLSPEGQAPSQPSQDLSGLTGFRPRPSTLQDVVQSFGPSAVNRGSEGPGGGLLEGINLCDDSPISGLTALSNGTILIFKGELFWPVNPDTRSVGAPQNIVDSLGIPSPIDTVFTRCNCEGKTYIIKGDQVWRLDANMIVEPGYPKPLTSEFPGLTGSIAAALAVPGSRGRAETVYFFKKGDIMQRFSFPAGSAPSCETGSRRSAGQSEVLLSGEISLSSLTGLPIPVTSALSMTSPQRSEPYQHYLFSGPIFFSIKISGDLPELFKPETSASFSPLLAASPVAAETSSANMGAPLVNPSHPANSIRVWLRCP